MVEHTPRDHKVMGSDHAVDFRSFDLFPLAIISVMSPRSGLLRKHFLLLRKVVALLCYLHQNMLTIRKTGKTKGILLLPIKRNGNTLAGGGA